MVLGGKGLVESSLVTRKGSSGEEVAVKRAVQRTAATAATGNIASSLKVFSLPQPVWRRQAAYLPLTEGCAQTWTLNVIGVGGSTRASGLPAASNEAKRWPAAAGAARVNQT
jgi:hypothetical protein